MDFAADLTILMQDFGVNYTYNGSTFRGIFDDEYEGISTGAEVDFALNALKLTCREVDVPNVRYAEQITINSIVYNVVLVMPSNKGTTELQLEKD
jgi:hypothetical protein